MTDATSASDAWLVTPHRYLERNAPRYRRGFRRTSRYVTVRDGTRLAVDVHLPLGAGDDETFPALLLLTPYYRRFALRPGHDPEVQESPNTGHYRDFFVPRGYAVVVADVRGTGASFGSRDGFRSPVERADAYDLADWVTSQGWCNGRIGSTGISYVGAAADFLATTGHPSVKGVVPTFAVWDTYADHFYPGGLLLDFLPPAYNALMEALDLDRREALARYPYFSHPDLAGPAPVDEDAEAVLRDAAVAEHYANVNANDMLRELAYSDAGLSYAPEYTSAVISPYHYAHEIRPEVAYYCVSGWYDGGGYCNAAVKRFLSLPIERKHLLLGPWDHGARTNVSPFREAMVPGFELLGECLRFFDHYVRGVDTGLEAEQPVHYFQMGEERWHACADWPPRAARETAWYLRAGNALGPDIPSDDGADEYHADYAAGTGTHTRYERLRAAAVQSYYDDWHGRDERMLAYTSAPFEADTELTGHAVVSIEVGVSERDAAFFFYIEDVDPSGHCRYVTEGMLRALHRKVIEAPSDRRSVGPYHSFARADAALLEPGERTRIELALFPVSWLFRANHRLRLAIALADRDHFVRIPGGHPPRIEIHRGAAGLSRVLLPLAARG
ncbi:MAG: CocE/NonD family hydrolase [Gammaproteobacteria bacterium]|nr:CocE/NonD family hydrolase [Gammaproteobacteria bacterium]